MDSQGQVINVNMQMEILFHQCKNMTMKREFRAAKIHI